MSEKTFPFLKFHRALPQTVPVAIRVLGNGEIHGGFVNGDASDQSARCIDCGNPYCSWGCPLANRIPQWLQLVRDGRIEDAASLMHETNPLPEICGRVCPQDRLCEGACTLEEGGFGAVTIGSVERWVTDEALRRGWRPSMHTQERTGQRVAIVGAGPAGLSAADRLIRAGIAVDVFDRYEEIGGLLTFGIPSFKLEKSVVRQRRQVLEEFGVQFRLGIEIGRDIAFSTLVQDYDAVFVATGAYTSVDAQLPGRELPGVHSALPFLVANTRRLLGSDVGEALPDLAGKRVVVLGGGDTAMDCVRSSIRLGAARVACVYRRDEGNMPGSRREVKYAREEGVEFVFQRQPLAIQGEGRVESVRLAQTELVADSSGRPASRNVAGSERDMPADIVIEAFGFLASPPDWCIAQGIATDRQGRILVGGPGRAAQQTSHAKVFAGGDTVRGADLVVRAVLDGREAARSILAQLQAVTAST
ncbi:glutamate synthase (NADPH) small subunit [Tahibacter aquaticus]|uniref:Glutamate synthase (NADPH) small subunit n=1 Tax=Tahibacter aquaticus TaxID=520092 RepID=A0A4R6Z6N4_9GAMM|nr:FAD-dependent oxidoreductase [Tahibacter aquaticus]TDR47423.1 glutamate synthase (NADPH) small subunit [Tahibacter aquaticus]